MEGFLGRIGKLRALGLADHILEVRLAHSLLDNVADDRAAVTGATSPYVERTLLRLLDQIVDRREIAVAALQDFFVNTRRKTGDSVINGNRLIARERSGAYSGIAPRL